MERGLIMIDVQNDYFADGTMELVAMDVAASNCKKLLDSLRQKEASIFHIQHIATKEGATFFLPNTYGCEIHKSVKPRENELVIIKHYPNSFRETDLSQMLDRAGVKELIICGAMTHMCVDTTTRAAFDLGYKCHVIYDACATRNLEFNRQLISAIDVQASFMAALSVPFAQISSTEQYLNAS